MVDFLKSNPERPWRRKANRSNRRGAVSLWVILVGPALLGMLILVIELAHLWLSRIELENALGSAALAAVKEWGDAGGGSTECPRNVGVAYAAGNTIAGVPLGIFTNLGGGPNENASCDGNLIFGAITNFDVGPPYIFDAAADAGCARVGQVRIEICKANSGASISSQPRMLGIFYEDGDADLSVRSVSLTVDNIRPGNPQQPYFDGSASESPTVSDYDFADPGGPNALGAALTWQPDTGACRGNRNTPNGMGAFVGNTIPAVGTVIQTNDVYGGLDDPGTPGLDESIDPDPQSNGTWDCLVDPPNPANWPGTGNDRGDICFGFSDPVVCGPCSGRFRTVTIYFRDGVFNPPDPPLPGPPLQGPVEFVRFAVSMNQFNPPALPGEQNDGNAFANHVTARITFVDNANPPNEFVCTARFVNGGTDRSIAVCDGGSGGGNPPAVRAQATVEVESLFCELCGIPLGPFFITAKETAYYDCALACPRLIRIEPANFFCPGPAP